MDKIPLPLKILYWTITFIFSLIAFYFLMGVFKASSPLAAAACFLLFAFFLLLPAIITSQLLSHWVSRKAAGAVYWPGENVELLPPDFSEVRSDIVKGDYYKAIDKLESKIKEDPANPIPVALLSDIYIDHLKKYKEAIIILANFLNKPERTEEDVPFVMKLVDVLLEVGQDDKATRLLQREVTLKYNEQAIIPLKKRLDGITT